MEIFHYDEDELDLPMPEQKPAPESALEQAFQTDEIDDPFSTAQDKQIAETDICERLQVKLAGRMKPDEAEISAEAEWIENRLAEHWTFAGATVNEQAPEYEYRYQNLHRKKDARLKIRRVLTMLRTKLLDVPLITHHRKYEYADELDEDAIAIIFALDQEYGKFQRHKQQISDFLQRITEINPQLKAY